MESEEKKKAYNEYVERITPNNSLTKDMWNAFWIGGLICVMGQIWLELFMYFGMDKEDSASYTTLILILESAILTGLNVYPKIAKKRWRRLSCPNNRICQRGCVSGNLI